MIMSICTDCALTSDVKLTLSMASDRATVVLYQSFQDNWSASFLFAEELYHVSLHCRVSKESEEYVSLSCCSIAQVL